MKRPKELTLTTVSLQLALNQVNRLKLYCADRDTLTLAHLIAASDSLAAALLHEIRLR